MKDKDSIFGAEPERLRDLIRAGMDVEGEDAQDKPAANVKVGKIMERPGTRIGSYKLLKVLGEGGMGMVYLAEQEQFIRRRVALKIIKPGMDSKRVLARFESERQALALLDHPNIAQVYDAGTSESGRPYFVMEYVKGIPITEFCDQRSLSIEQRLRLFQQLCNALQHAHQKGIIHRDIKPSNILISSENDQIIPKIIDFGVAKAVTQPLTDRTLITEQDQLLGTPEYMSPEQVELASDDIDTRSDIYSLGVLLYELLTGVLPFDSKTLRTGGIENIRKVIRETDPKTPSTRLTKLGDEAKKVAESRRTEVAVLARCLHKELEWIPLKAMRKERSERYRSASELSDDIENYLNGNPLIAGPPSTAYRLRKFIRRHKALVTGAAAVLVVLLAGIFVSTIFGIEAYRQKQIAIVERDNAQQAKLIAEQAKDAEQQQRVIVQQQAEKYSRSLYLRNINLADRYYFDNYISLVRDLLKECPEDLRKLEWNYLVGVSDQSLMTLRGHTAGVFSVAFSPDGRRIVSGGNWLDKTIKVWNAETGDELFTLEGHKIGIRSVAFSHDGSRIVSGSADANCIVWDAESGKELFSLEGHEAAVNSVAFNHDSSRIVSGYGGTDRNIKVWDAESGVELFTIEGHEGGVRSVAFSPDGSRIVSGSADANCIIWDAESGNKLFTLEGHEDGIHSVAFGPDGKKIVSGSADMTIRIWDAESGSELLTLRGHKGLVGTVAFSHDGSRIVSNSEDTTIKVWDAESSEVLRNFEGHEGQVNSVALSPDRKKIVSGSADANCIVWDAETGNELFTLEGHEAAVGSVTFNHDGSRIVSGSVDANCIVWDAESGVELFTLEGHQGPVRSVVFSPDGSRIVSGSLDANCIVWNAETGDELFTFEGHEGGVRSVAFSPDGRRIASGGNWTNPVIRVWDAESGVELFTIEGHESAVRSVAYNRDGSRIVSGSVDKTLRVWDAENGSELMTLRGHNGPVNSIALNPDGDRIVSSGGDGTIKIWDTESGSELVNLRGHEGSVSSAFFRPDDSRIVSIVSGGADSTIKIWNIPSKEEAEAELLAEEQGRS